MDPSNEKSDKAIVGWASPRERSLVVGLGVLGAIAVGVMLQDFGLFPAVAIALPFVAGETVVFRKMFVRARRRRIEIKAEVDSIEQTEIAASLRAAKGDDAADRWIAADEEAPGQLEDPTR